MSIEERQRAHPKNYQKMPKIYRNLAFDHLKTVYKMLRPEIFPVFDNIFTANMLRIRKKRGLLPSEPVLQYNCSVKTFLKLMIMIEHIKMIQIHCLDIWSMLLSRQVPHRTNLNQLFWNGLFQKKKPNRAGGRGRGVEDILFLKKKTLNCFGFSLYP